MFCWIGKNGEVELGGAGKEERRVAGSSDCGLDGCKVVALLRVEMRFWRWVEGMGIMGEGRVTGTGTGGRRDFRRKVRKRNIVVFSLFWVDGV